LKKDSKLSMHVPAVGNLSWRTPRKEKDPEVEKPEKQNIPSDPVLKKEELPSTHETIEEDSSKAVDILEDMNHLCAKALQAQLIGDETAYHKAIENIAKKQSDIKAIVVPRFDHRGRPLPASSGHQDRRGKRRKRGTNDEENVSLKTLISQEKGEEIGDYNMDFVNHMTKDQQWMESGFDGESASRKKNKNSEEKSRQRAIASHKKFNNLLENCWFCFENPNIDKKLIVSLGEHTYLALPKKQRLIEGHCLIIPLKHCISIATADEEVWEEIQFFKKSLIKMFSYHKKEVIFMETIVNLKKNFHTFIDCIPLPKKTAQAAPGYFKKALLESEAEWTDNRKLIDTTGRGIRRSVPKELPYFNVEFGVKQGFAHIVESTDFPTHFGKEILGGMLELPHNLWKKPKDEDSEVLRKQVLKFIDDYKAFDWTVNLEGGDYQDSGKQDAVGT